IGPHLVSAVATDDQGANSSALLSVVIYDANGTPLARMTGPTNNATFDGPTNLTLTPIANSINGVTNVQFLTNGDALANDPSSPYSVVWTNATFGTNLVAAVAFDAQGARGTSAVITVIVKAPPPNTNAPTIFSKNPAAGAGVTNLTSIQVIFSE